MISSHQWKCENCDSKLFLKVDDQKEVDRIKLAKFQEYVSMHVFKNQHTMTHKEKEDKGFRYV